VYNNLTVKFQFEYNRLLEFLVLFGAVSWKNEAYDWR